MFVSFGLSVFHSLLIEHSEYESAQVTHCLSLYLSMFLIMTCYFSDHVEPQKQNNQCSELQNKFERRSIT